MGRGTSDPNEKHARLGNELAMILGTNVERLRTGLHLTKSNFALMIGISRPTLNAIEAGTHDARLGLILDLAEALEVDALDLLRPPEV